MARLRTCLSMPRGWSAARFRLAHGGAAAASRFRLRSSPTCSTGSIGVTRSTHSGPNARDNALCGGFGGASELIRRPDDVATLKAELAARPRRRWPTTRRTIARQNLEIAKLKRQIYGPRSERGSLIDQMELELEDLEGPPPPRTRSPPSELPPRRRRSPRSRGSGRPANPCPSICRASASIDAGANDVCQCCGGAGLKKLGETVARRLEAMPRRWKVIQRVREKMVRAGTARGYERAARRRSTSRRAVEPARTCSPCCCSEDSGSIGQLNRAG